jgi:hypothetical protein
LELTFIKGLDLSHHLYREAVRPLLESHFPGLVYSAALIGPGSDVLGFDTPQSRDHDWGPRLMLFLDESDFSNMRDEINQVLRRNLPSEICGYSTNYGTHPDGTSVMVPSGEREINHRVDLLTVTPFFRQHLCFDPMVKIRPRDWVSVPEQNLLMLTAGQVFHDGLDRLVPLREKLAYYPRDVWLYLLAAGWRRIAQEEAFLGRCGQIGDELGSRLLAARLVRDLMRLCFLMERRYAPYIKWFGSAFAQLKCAGELNAIFAQVLKADAWQEREKHLSGAYRKVSSMHNQLGISTTISPEVSFFHERPFQVIHAERFVETIRAEIRAEAVLALPKYLGGFDQIIDSTDAQNQLERIKAVFE